MLFQADATLCLFLNFYFSWNSDLRVFLLLRLFKLASVVSLQIAGAIAERGECLEDIKRVVENVIQAMGELRCSDIIYKVVATYLNILYL